MAEELEDWSDLGTVAGPSDSGDDDWSDLGKVEPQPRKPLGRKNDPYLLPGNPELSTPGGRQVYDAENPPYDENAFVKARKVVNGTEYTLHSETGVVSDPDGRVTTDPDILKAFGKTAPTQTAVRQQAVQDEVDALASDKVDVGEFSNAFMRSLGPQNLKFLGETMGAYADITGDTSFDMDAETLVQTGTDWENGIAEPAVPTLDKINITEEGGLGRAWDWTKQAAGAGFGSTVVPMAGGLAGGVLGGRVAGRWGAAAGAFGGAFMGSNALNVGSMRQTLKEEGLANDFAGRSRTPEQEAQFAKDRVLRGQLAVAGGSVMSALDSVLPGEIAEKLVGSARREVERSIAKRLLKGALKGSVKEGMTEAVQEATEYVIGKFGTGKDIDPNELGKIVLEAAAQGAIVGGPMQGATDAATGGPDKNRPIPEFDPPQGTGTVTVNGRTMAYSNGKWTGELKPQTTAGGKTDREVPPPGAPRVPPKAEMFPPDVFEPRGRGSPDDWSDLGRPGKGTGKRNSPVHVSTAEDVADAGMQVNGEPTDAQKEAGNYKKGHAKVQGLDITIENPEGSERRGKAPDGSEWSVTMPAAYGYVKRTKGADGDQVDVFIGPKADTSDKVFVIDQVDADTGNFDEHKAVLGVDSADEAASLYHRSFSDGRGVDRIANMVEMSMDEFKTWAKRGNTTKPLWGNRMLPPSQYDAEAIRKPAPAPAEIAPPVASAPKSEAPAPGTAKPAPRPSKAPQTSADQIGPNSAGIASAETGQTGPDVPPAPPGNLSKSERIEKPAGIKRRDVADDVAITSSGRKVPVKYAVVEAADLVPSQMDDGNPNPAYPAELQPRDRERRVSATQIHDIASRLEPRLLDKSAKASDGAPIVSEDGTVESGNGRTLAIRRAYERNMPGAEKYRAHLKEQGYPVDGMQQPVLVRVREGKMESADRQAFTREANERDTLAMSAPERAMADASQLSDGVLQLYRGGDIDEAGNREFTKAFLRDVVAKNDQGNLVDETGKISQEAVRRIGAALLAKAYGDSDLISALTESTDINIKGIGGALLDNAGAWAQMRAEAGRGEISREVDQTEALLEAVRMVERSRKEGKALGLLVGQNDIFTGKGIALETEFFLRLMFRDTDNWKLPVSRKSLSEALQFYVAEARKTQEGADLLGETAPPAKDILATAKRKQVNEQEGDSADQGQLALQKPAVKEADDADGEDAGEAGAGRPPQDTAGEEDESGSDVEGEGPNDLSPNGAGILTNADMEEIEALVGGDQVVESNKVIDDQSGDATDMVDVDNPIEFDKAARKAAKKVYPDDEQFTERNEFINGAVANVPGPFASNQNPGDPKYVAAHKAGMEWAESQGAVRRPWTEAQWGYHVPEAYMPLYDVPEYGRIYRARVKRDREFLDLPKQRKVFDDYRTNSKKKPVADAYEEQHARRKRILSGEEDAFLDQPVTNDDPLAKESAELAGVEAPTWWTDLTEAGRRPIIERISSTLSPKVTWNNLSDENRKKAQSVYEAMQKESAEAPTWAEVMSALPKDAKGNADLETAARLMFEVSGIRQPSFKDLTPKQQTELLDLAKAEAKAAALPPRETGYGDKNTFVTKDRAEELRRKLRDKLRNQVSAGIDPEMLAMGAELAAFHIEAGARKFGDFARAVAADLGTTVQALRPYLRGWYNGARDMMEDNGLDVAGMDDAEAVKAELRKLFGEAVKDNSTPSESPDSGQTDTPKASESITPPATDLFGTPVPEKRKKAAKPDILKAWGAQKLTDFGTQPIDGYDEYSEGAGLRKAQFLTDAQNYLKKVAQALEERGYINPKDKKGKPRKAVSINEGGVAVSGDVYLDMMRPGGLGIQVQVTQSVAQPGTSVIARTKAESGSLGGNNWWPATLTVDELAARIDALVALESGRLTPTSPEAQSTPAPKEGMTDEQPVQGSRGLGDEGEPETRPGLAGGQQGGTGSAGEVAQPAAPNDGGTGENSGERESLGARPDGSEAEGTGTVRGERDADPGRGTASSSRVADAGAGSGEQPAPVRPNYHLTDPERLVGGGPKARFAKNRKAIETYQALADEGRDPTAEELDAMAAYIGWGSFGQELFNGSWERPQPKENWQEEDKWLRDHLGEEQWKSAQTTIINAHYTDPPTVTAMWNIVRKLGFTGGRVLEPSMGIGNFYALMPRDLMGRSDLTGIEMDTLTGGMAKILYPQANVQIKGYQDSKTPDGFYDLVIGNWPFSPNGPADRRYDKLNASLHDYFFIKALDQVRPGGFVIGITSAGTMDKIGRVQRINMASKAELVAAFRLPSGAFEKYAGTAVVTDLIIFQKREKGRPADAPTENWIDTVKLDTDAGEAITVNRYWTDNPDHVLGHMTFGSGTTYGRAAMIVNRLADFPQRLADLPNRVPEGIYVPPNRPPVRYIVNNTADRQGFIIEKNGKFYVVQGEHLGALEDLVKYKVKDAAKTASREAQLTKIVAIRKALGAVMDAERDGAANTEALRKTLKNLYDRFVQSHGKLAKSDGLSILQKANDPSASMLRALEKPNGDPALIFTQATVRQKRNLANPTVRDAFVTVRNESVNVNLDRVAELAKVTKEQATQELLESGAILRTPGKGYEIADQYLSGNVRLKLREAEAALANGEDMQASIDALRKVIPRDIPYYQIEAKLGAPWVANEVYQKFIAELLGITETDKISVRLKAGYWKVGFKDGRYNDRSEATTRWGHAAINFDKLLTRAMGNQAIRIMTKDENGNKILDTTATAEANNKAMLVREEFQSWAWRDAERKIALEKQYNEQLNAIATPRYDGSFLEFSGMSLTRGEDQFSLRQHQVNAIYRGLVNQRGIFAHEVGTGKTYTMAGIAIESRKYGLAQKPLLFAHNANSASVAREAQEMYPGAKIMYVDNSDGDIATTLQRIATDDWDLIVVPHSLIDRFALTQKTLSGLAAEEISALEDEALEAIKEDTGEDLAVADLDDEKKMAGVRSTTAKQLVRQRQSIIENIAKMAARASRENAIMFEDMGVDMVIVDEAHEFKKPPLATRMSLKGLNKDTSNRSIALQFLTHYVKQLRNGKGVLLFTGTPITNTLTEIYKMMRFVMDDQMQLAGVKDWDTWFNTFADSSSDVELTATGDYEPVTRLSQFVNVAELRRMIGQYTDIVFADDMPEFKPRETATGKTLKSRDLTDEERSFLTNGRSPNPIGRPYKKVMVEVGPMSPEQEAELERQITLAQQFKSGSGRQRREWLMKGDERVPIRTETAIANASLDVRLALGEQAEDHPESKANRAVRRVMEHYREDARSTQVIFMERGFSSFTTVSQGKNEDGSKKPGLKVKRFNLVEDIIAKLVAQGIPREQIAVVDGSVSKEKRKEIADAMNDAKIRVVIGSTDTLGVGVNMQRHLRAMHLLDAPWMPGELIQRNGRGERQGNEWNTVLEYRYITDKLDGRRWQVLAIKDRFIRAFLTAAEDVRVIDGDAVEETEGDDADGLAKTLSEAAGDPRLMRINKYRADMERLERRERMHTYGIAEAKGRIRGLEDEVQRKSQLVARMERDAAAYAEVKKAESFEATINGKTYSERKAAEEALAKFIAGLDVGDEDTLGTVQGFPINYWVGQLGVRITISRNAEYVANTGTIASIEATLRNIASRRDKLQEEIAEAQASIPRMQEMLSQPFGQQAQLDKVRRLYEETNADLVMNPVPPPSWLRHGAPVGTQIFVDGLAMDVEGHRYTSEGWFVVTPQGDVPYLEAKDEQGNMLYEGRVFTPPVEKPWMDKLSDAALRKGYKTQIDEKGTWHVLTPGLATATSGPTEVLAIRAFNMNPNFRDVHNTAPSSSAAAPQRGPTLSAPDSPIQPAPPFYSSLLRTVTGLKMAKAPAAQWLATLKNQPGVKQEEMDWLGLAEWLNAQPGPVTKEALADFIRANQVQVQEVVKGGTKDEESNFYGWRVERLDDGTWTYGDPESMSLLDDEAIRAAGFDIFHTREEAQASLDAEKAVPTKFASYQLPGGENYRELLLTLPERAGEQKFSGYVLPSHDSMADDILTELSSEGLENAFDYGRTQDNRGNEVIEFNDLSPSQWQRVRAIVEEAGGNLRQVSPGPQGWNNTNDQTAEGDINFRSSHWEEPNVLAHVRFNEREVDGKRVLFIEEIQSDWHQQGRKRGYARPEKIEWSEIDSSLERWWAGKREGGGGYAIYRVQPNSPLAKKSPELANTYQLVPYDDPMRATHHATLEQAKAAAEKGARGVPDAPFKTTWPELALKRMIRWAAEHGFDSIAWTPGEVQAERYDLSKQVEVVRLVSVGKDGVFNNAIFNAIAKNGTAINRQITSEKDLEDVIGKEVARKLLEATPVRGTGGNNGAWVRELSGLDLKIGGEGMRGFYDKMLVDTANKLGKKFGVKVSRAPIGSTPPVRYRIISDAGTNALYDTREDAEEYYRRLGYRVPPVLQEVGGKSGSIAHTLPITPDMRMAALEGQPLFSPQPPGDNEVSPTSYTPLHKFVWRSAHTLASDARDYVVTQGEKLRNIEVILAFNRVGMILADGHGPSHGKNVDLPESTYRALTTPGSDVVVHHNHPHGGSLSLPDIVGASWPGAGAVWAHGNDGSYRATVSPEAKAMGVQAFGDLLRSQINRVMEPVVSDLQARVQGSGMSADDANFFYFHAMNLALHKAGVIDYFTNAPYGSDARIEAAIDQSAALIKEAFANVAIQLRPARPVRFRGDVGILPEGYSGGYQPQGQGASAQGAGRDNRGREGGAAPGYGQGVLTLEAPTGPFFTPPEENARAALHDQSKSMLGRLMSATEIAILPARRKLQDRVIDLKRFIETIAKQTGQPMPDVMNTYVREALYYGRAGQQLEDLRIDRVEPMVKILSDAGISLKEFDTFLYASHAEERNARIAQINPDMPEAGSGMTDDTARAILSSWSMDPRYGAMQEAAQMLWAINAETRQRMLDSGLISEEQKAAWDDMYAYYVPLRGFEGETAEENMPAGKRFDIRGREAEAALGRQSSADSPAVYSLTQAQLAIIRSEKNRVGQSFLRLAMSNPNPDVWEVNPVTNKRVLNPQTGLVENIERKITKLRENVLSVKVNGQEYYVQIHHPGMAAAMKGLGNEGMNILARSLHLFTRFQSYMHTAANFEFVLSNFSRDVQTGLVHLGEQGVKGLRGRVLADIPKAIAGSYQAMRGNTSSQWAQHFRDYADAGGRISFFDLQTIEKQRAELDAMFKRLNRSPLQAAKNSLGAVKEFVETLNGAIENGIRLSTFVHLRRAGFSKDKAAFAARELTVNFNRKGELGPNINALYLFFNASIQGSVRVALSALNHKQTRRVIVGIIALGFLQEIINGLTSGDDDDDEKFYDKIPEWEKDRNLIFMVPGSETGGYLKFPMPYGYNSFHGLGRNLAAVLRNRKGTAQALGDTISSFLNSFNPIGGGGTPLSFFAPTILDPMADIYTNRDWQGRPIYPKPFPKQSDQPDSQTYWKHSVSDWARVTAEYLNEATGGNEVRPGWFDVSPETLDYMADYVAGGAGAFANRVQRYFYKSVKGEEVEPNQVPFGRIVYGQNSRFQDRQVYYEIANEAGILNKEIELFMSKGDREAAKAAEAKYPAAAAVRLMVKTVEGNLRELRKQRRALEASGKATDEKMQLLDERMDMQMLRVRRAYFQALRK